MALKIGTEDKKKVAIAAALVVGVVMVALWQLRPYFGGTQPAPLPPTVVQAPARPGEQPATTGGTEHEATKISGSLASLDPTLHPEWMEVAESLEYAGKGRNIFSMESAPVEIPKPIESPRPVADQGPPPPPPPPPIDLKFFGYEAQAGGSNRKAFLLHGDDVFIASVGDVVDHRYKIVGIQPLSIQVEDLPYNNTQTLQLVQN